ncbi:MAG TPA: MFS transporter [Pseudonocardia sp.]|nr:MFS transporter [Pseudonocardia sp.]
MTELLAGARALDLGRARNAVVVAFAMNGLSFASWLSRAPAVRDALSLSTAQLGLLLLCLSGGACASLPLSGAAVHRLGPARVVLLGSIAVGIGLLALAAGVGTGTVWPAAVGLVLAGVGNSNWDVAMNVAGADVERRRARTLMPQLHAAFSLGTVAGGGAGAACAALGVPVAAQVLVAAALAPLVVSMAVRAFPPAADHGRADDGTRRSGNLARTWLEPRTLLIGVVTLAFAFTEGSANDWLAVALVDGHHTGEVLGALGFGAFVTAMTLGRLSGGVLLERFGRVHMLRATSVLAVAGLALVTLAGSISWVVVGALLWGLGASLGFPVGMSAAADDPARAAARVGVVSSIAYTAFLAGPPVIGLLAQHTGILHALLVVLGVLVVGLLGIGAVRPLPAADQSDD